MTSSKRTRCIVVLAIMAAAVVVVIVMILRERTKNITFRTQNEVVQIAQEAMSEMIFTSPSSVQHFRERPFSFPRGNIQDFTAWLMERDRGKYLATLNSYISLESLAFTDFWGRDLVYRFPPRRKDILFELYSKGPNGVDDGGEGDDLTADAVCTFAHWKEYFKDGIVDTDSLWANLDRLEWRYSTKGRYIVIGDKATPEKAGMVNPGQREQSPISAK